MAGPRCNRIALGFPSGDRGQSRPIVVAISASLPAASAIVHHSGAKSSRTIRRPPRGRPQRGLGLVVWDPDRDMDRANIRAEIARGNESWFRDWADAGGDERAAADDAWIARHRAALIMAARG